jgi:glycosyltransferase involved in cell wall biosynthesis
MDEVFRNKFDNETIYFFEYLDNSIGYCLKSQNIIKDYINDLHGVATLEFKFQSNHATSLKVKIMFYVKYIISNLLDAKVFNNAKSLIFASQAMIDFFCNSYPKVSKKKNYILPYVLSSDAIDDKVNDDLKKELIAKYNVRADEKIIFFAGAFKKTGGVPDLVLAFSNLVNDYNTRLFVVGDGPTMEECLLIVKDKRLAEKVVFFGRIPYQNLRTYQDLADIIVCSDKQNIYSDLIVHVKYFDALISGKLVINGCFKSVKEINKEEFLSIDFIPSNTKSLESSIKYALNNLEVLNEKYINNRTYVIENLTYSNFVGVLEN